MKQKWGKLKKNAKSLYEAIPIKQFCHGKPKAPIYKLHTITAEDRKLFFSWAIESCPNSEIAKVRQQYRSNPLPDSETSSISQEYCREILSSPIQPPLDNTTRLFGLRAGNRVQEVTLKDLPQPLVQFYEKNVRVTLDQAVKIATDAVGQGSKSWLEARSIRITASKARELITYSTNRNPDWGSKIANYYSSKFQGCPETAHGVRAEPSLESVINAELATRFWRPDSW